MIINLIKANFILNIKAAVISIPRANSLTCSRDNLFPSMLVDKWALWIMASRLKMTLHFGIKGELRIVSLAAEILVSHFTVLLVYLNFSLNIFYILHWKKRLRRLSLASSQSEITDGSDESDPYDSPSP